MSELCLTHLALCYSCENNNSNKNNFILCTQELDSLPVLAGQDSYTNNITITLNYYKALQIATFKRKHVFLALLILCQVVRNFL